MGRFQNNGITWAMILHVDMDAFYAAIEQRDRPELRGVCVIVGGSIERGVVSTASYEARKYGVHSAMPIFQARKRCPTAVIIPPRMEHYRAVSREILNILRTYSPRVEAVSIDEAYLDVYGCERSIGTPEAIALEIKHRVGKEVGLTCSIGVAPVKFLAKIASEMRKPDGLFIIQPEDVAGVVQSLPIRKVPGVGPKTAEILEVLQIRTLGDVNRFPRETLVRRLGKYGDRLAELAVGFDAEGVTTERENKSISSETTLMTDTDDLDVLMGRLLCQADEVGCELRKKGLWARTVTLKIKHADFKQITRSVTLSSPVRTADGIHKAAAELLKAYKLAGKVRLIGVGASGLLSESRPRQLDLFCPKQNKSVGWDKVETAVDRIERRFGKGLVRKARLLENP